MTGDERQRLKEIERKAQQDFPPADSPKRPLPRNGIAARIRRARKAQGLTWNAVAKLADIPNSNTIRDIESGEDAKLSSVEAVAKALGLKLEGLRRERRGGFLFLRSNSRRWLRNGTRMRTKSQSVVSCGRQG